VTRYASGRRAEWRARDWLRRRGYTVIRSAGSKGLVDLVAWREPRSIGSRQDVIFVQVKYTRSKGGAWIDDNWRVLARKRMPIGVRVCAIVYRHGNTTPEVRYADEETT
jgi:Holliday junction resolvase-like predicted endonuclease